MISIFYFEFVIPFPLVALLTRLLLAVNEEYLEVLRFFVNFPLLREGKEISESIYF